MFIPYLLDLTAVSCQPSHQCSWELGGNWACWKSSSWFWLIELITSTDPVEDFDSSYSGLRQLKILSVSDPWLALQVVPPYGGAAAKQITAKQFNGSRVWSVSLRSTHLQPPVHPGARLQLLQLTSETDGTAYGMRGGGFRAWKRHGENAS